MLLKIFFLTIFFFSSSIFSNELKYNCTFDEKFFIEDLRNQNNLLEIKIKINDYRSWIKNGMRIVTDINKNIKNRYKKRYSGIVTAKYSFGECEFKARIRQHGDWKDHIQYISNENKFSQSLNIRLENGNILGIVDFILFIPKTRNNSNEILTTSILTELGHLAPRTFFINTNINEHKSSMIFQEKIRKEFLEINQKRESALFEGEEQFIWEMGVNKNSEDFRKYESVSLSRMINSTWATRNKTNLLISKYSYSKLQNVYLNYAKNLPNSDIFYSLDIELLSNFSNKLFRKWLRYELLILSINAQHALRPHNRKFYWNNLYEGFEPIYYDGDTNFIQICDSKGKLLSNYLGEKDIQYYKNVFKRETYEELINSINILKNKNKFNSTLEKNTGLEKDDIKQLYNLIESNIDCLKNNLIQLENKNPKKINFHENYSIFKNNLKKLNLDSLLFENYNNKNLLCINNKCDETFMPNLDTWNKVLKRDYVSDKIPVIFIGMIDENKKNSFYKMKLDKDIINIKHSDKVKIIYNNQKKELNIYQNKYDDRVVIFDSKIQDLKVYFYGKKFNNLDNLINYEKEIFTGCLTFENIYFHNIDIVSSDGKCEDSINFINSSGYINTINVKNSFSDALDFDFSDNNIREIKISNAGNDCVDFSFGNHQIAKLELQDCGDKGISVGELSKIFIDESKIVNSYDGIVSKDTSKIKIDNAIISNVKNCFSSYNKKQEFNGGYIAVKNFNCSNFNNQINIDFRSNFIEVK